MPTAFTKRASDPEDVWRRVTGPLDLLVEANMPIGVPTQFVPAPDVIETITRPAPPQTAPTVIGATSFSGRVMTLSVLELTGNPEPTLSQVSVVLTVNTNPVDMTLVQPGTWTYTFASDDEPAPWSVLLTVDTGVAPAGTWSASGTVEPDIVGVPLVLEPTGSPAYELRASGSGPVAVSVGSPAPYIGGPFTADLSEEGGGLIEFEASQLAPQCLIRPAMVRTTGETDEIGAVYTYVPGIWTEGEDAPGTFTRAWDVFRDGVALGLTNPATYEATAAGVHEFRETITGAGATRTARSNLIGVAGAVVPVDDVQPGIESIIINSLAPLGPNLVATTGVESIIIELE